MVRGRHAARVDLGLGGPCHVGQCRPSVLGRLGHTLTGIFGIGQPPTGSRDPFALRRAALGLLRTLIENNLALDLQPLLEQAAAGHAKLAQRDTVVDSVRDYIFERLRAWYGDAGIAVECFLAVQARNVTRPLDFDRRVRAVAEFTALPEAAALAAANAAKPAP